MALWLRDIKLDLTEDESRLPAVSAELLGVAVEDLLNFKVVRRAIDARKKSRILYVYTVEFNVDDEPRLLAACQDKPALATAPELTDAVLPTIEGAPQVVVVGMGPCGLFAAKRLAEAGARVVLIEQGRPVEARVRDVERFWQGGELDFTSNVQFGEGGAGTFSDGKLTTRLNHPRLRSILETFVGLGAPERILVESRPHIGTDRLRDVLIRFRRELEGLGVDLRFETCLTGLEVAQDKVVGAVFNDRDALPCDALVLAPGHSARATYRLLERYSVSLEPKAFAIGVRVEHPAELINRAQYGHFCDRLPAADYALRFNDKASGRGVYSFCMCPGGEVVNASSEAGGLVVNGMSRSTRTGQASNSALVVTVNPEDWNAAAGPLAGMAYQQEWERKAFAVAGGYTPPAQNLMDFMGAGQGPVVSTCRPGVVEARLDEVLPPVVVAGLRQALPHFDRKIRGFMTSEAVLVGVETRTSAPVRVLRDKQGESISHPGLFPAGEGAGYAGGIMSSALDGLFVADQVIQKMCHRSCV